MDSPFHSVVQNSTVLSEALRQKLLSKAEQLSSKQMQTLIQLLTDAEAKKQAAVERAAQDDKATYQTFLEQVNDFIRHEFPKLMREAEHKDRESESSELEGILSELDQI